MSKITLKDLDLDGKKVFIRVDFNVPLKDGWVSNDLRIRESLATITYCMEKGATLVLASHLGRPKGKPKPEYSLAPVAERLSELLGQQVIFVPECVGPEADRAIAGARPGEVLLLENLRFHPEEEANDPEFARRLTAHTSLYINDAFGAAHRAHASTAGITQFADKAAAGFLMEKELRYLGGALEEPERPFVAILGGSKISEKIEVIQNLLGTVSCLLIGGAMMFTFLKFMGKNIGRSLYEPDKVKVAEALMENSGAKILLPSDVVVAAGLDDAAGARVVSVDEIPDDMMGLDIGPQTAANWAGILRCANTILWNGPMGVFEKDAFAAGTLAIARAVAESPATSIVGGGDSAAAISKARVADRITHVSTGGGASLEFLAGRVLPGVAALTNR